MYRPAQSLNLLLCALLALLAGSRLTTAVALPDATARADNIIVSFDLVVVDRSGRVPDDLGPDDFQVTINGSPTRVLWVRHVSRGPGAESDAARRQDARRGLATFAAEPARTVLVLIDQTTMRQGSERAAAAAVNAFVDRLGLDDRLGVIRLPLQPETLIELSTDRPAAREAVRQTVSLAAPSPTADVEGLQARMQADPNRATVVDPDRAGDPERVVPPEVDRQLSALEVPPPQSEFDLALRGGALAGLYDLLVALGKAPGRKVVAFFSAGVHGATQNDVRRTALAAAAARAMVYAFGLDGARGPSGQMPDVGPLEAVAAATGGRYVKLDRKPERTIETVMPELSAAYVLGIEARAFPDRPVPMRVSLGRKTLVLRSPQWLAATEDPDDLVPVTTPASTLAPAMPAVAPGEGAPSGGDTAARRLSEVLARDEDLRHALARMTAYVESYVREYAALVAEEDYYQTAGTGSARQIARLRSDVLLVRPGDAKAWLCFRDVFEVDGRALRDREDRLKRLFLDPSLRAVAQLQAIKDESARHNVGPVIRNLNVPLFPLVVLERENLLRFRFKLGKKQESDGVERWRVDYEELLRPTIVTTNDDEDVPITGSFLMDPMTGAVIESSLIADTKWGRAELKTKYRRDALLGFWVPAEMTEYYRSRSYATLADGRATYGNFRRFQVRTEQTITVPK
ncbi:MAG: hypothetical protein AB1806_07750 [Acidobacteriota bacterium]